MGLSVVVIANDFTAMNVALATIEKDFDTDVTTVQWVINSYALTFGVLMPAASSTCSRSPAARSASA